MKRFEISLLTIFLAIGSLSCAQNQSGSEDRTSSNQITASMTGFEINKSEKEWKEELTPEQYNVMREKGTERAFSSPLNENKEKGVYVCAACENQLFSSETKFNSGTGWPSFYAPISEEKVATESDHSLGMVRNEVLCARCGSHLGHIFEDGPEPTGLRYCLNGVALDFKKAD